MLTRRHVGTATLVGIVTLVAILAIPDARAAAQRVAQRALLTADLSESSTQIKLDLWAVGVAIAADHPLVGVGSDNYVLVFDDYRDQVLPAGRAEQMARFRPESPHNVYLGWAVGAGLPALAAYLTIVAIVVRRLIVALRVIEEPRAWLLAAALFAAVCGHLVTDLFMTAETTGSLLFWTLLGVSAALFETSAKPREPSRHRPVGRLGKSGRPRRASGGTADAPALGAGVARRASSNLASPTIAQRPRIGARACGRL